MRDEYEDNFYVTTEERPPGWLGRLIAHMSTWAGAILALVVIGGLVLWGYRLGKLDASAVPVIHAAINPAKVQPDDPGGAEIPHQDITSYSAGDGTTAPSEITFAAPIERPTEEDVRMEDLQEPEASPEASPDGSTGETEVAVATPDAEAEPELPASDATDLAPEVTAAAPIRPGDLSQRMAIARRAISDDAELAKRAAASAVQIQLGAFADRSLTKSEWVRIYKANQDILSGRTLVVQSTISGGQRFFRLRVGPFKDRVEAQNICRALQSRGHDCIVAVNG
jgi:cell division protein FtsN